MTRAGRMTIGAVASILAATLGGTINCGGVGTSDVQSARNQATSASCNYFQMCQEIGSGLMYDTYADCQTQVLGDWTNGWPTSACQGHIDETALSKCIDAINANSTADCNGLAVLLTLGKCSEALVCGTGAADGGTD